MNYYPLIRGRQYDLLALREAVTKDFLSPHILPVIEPVKDLPALAAVARAFTDRKHPLFIVQNPQVGRYGLLARPSHVAVLSAWVHPARYFDGQPSALIIAETLAQAVALRADQLPTARRGPVSPAAAAKRRLSGGPHPDARTH
ncbi:sce7725 family protein [Lacticaseibacillus camelliae]|uniref:sce7725 family protein n=1 Tax=Lacticaseibacillus camelliae TaxID=381742 RepID=UPI000A54B008|nr:sce7725 family protein [Lacticaseibacillus camelliae]